MRISDWSSDVCSSDLRHGEQAAIDGAAGGRDGHDAAQRAELVALDLGEGHDCFIDGNGRRHHRNPLYPWKAGGRKHERRGRAAALQEAAVRRSEEHTSELQSLMRISYAVFCLKKKNRNTH